MNTEMLVKAIINFKCIFRSWLPLFFAVNLFILYLCYQVLSYLSTYSYKVDSGLLGNRGWKMSSKAYDPDFFCLFVCFPPVDRKPGYDTGNTEELSQLFYRWKHCLLLKEYAFLLQKIGDKVKVERNLYAEY